MARENVFGERLMKIMKKQRVSQTELAKLVGVSQGMISQYLKGSIPRGDLLFKIAEVLSADPYWLLTGKLKSEERDPELMRAFKAMKEDRMIAKIVMFLHDMPREKRKEILAIVGEKRLLAELLSKEERKTKKRG